jgi:hypothetical protein
MAPVSGDFAATFILLKPEIGAPVTTLTENTSVFCGSSASTWAGVSFNTQYTPKALPPPNL